MGQQRLSRAVPLDAGTPFRVGKTVLWTAARDERFAGVIASASGEGGAALSRRNYGETIAHLTAPSRYRYQFAGNYASWANRVDEFPLDAHLLLALIAPRPVLLQTGTEDRWSDPVGEFEAAVAAEPVFELLGAGESVAIFPQGTVRGGTWTRGAARLALTTGVPLVPVRIVGSRRAGALRSRPLAACRGNRTWGA